ncbi:MAG: GNAT family N-acetyltransferase [Chloroflexi bacterium]|nr:GNAT family N-acetyltransferase [Chloroflexota bacterium]
MKNKTLLDLNLSLRAVTWADVHAVAKLIYDVCEADGDTTMAATPEELEHEWHSAKFNPETDSYVIQASDGQLAAYAEVFNSQGFAYFNADIYVHPAFKGQGIFPALLARVDERAREEMKLAEPDLRVFIRSSMDGKDEEARLAHEKDGYVPVRFNWRMEINLPEAPSVPEFPAGIELRPFDKEAHAHLIWEAENEAFSEHWGSHASTIEEWSHRKLDKPEFDPTLWLIAWDGEKIAGFSQNRYRMGIGWVGTLGVRKPWRKHGLGMALLKHSFADFYQRGMKTVGLGVDAANSTGATRLYEKAGMHIVSEFITYDKELRPGQSLEE